MCTYSSAQKGHATFGHFMAVTNKVGVTDEHDFAFMRMIVSRVKGTSNTPWIVVGFTYVVLRFAKVTN